MITMEQLRRLAPRPDDARKAAIWDQYAEAITTGDDLFAEAGIDEARELQHFMAQIAHECDGFTLLWESGAYRVQGLLDHFGVGQHTACVTREEAEALCALRGEQRDRAIFERVYGLGNPRKARELGNTEPGDGYLYRGFGPLQTTGRADHERLLGGDASVRSALRAALREWDEKGCNALARADDLKSITRRINGGYNGLDSRRAYLAKAKRIWTRLDADSGRPPPPDNMLQSKEGNTAVALGTGGSIQVGTEISAAVTRVAETGRPFTVLELALALAQSPTFWVGVFFVVGPTLIWLWRHARLRHWGV